MAKTKGFDSAALAAQLMDPELVPDEILPGIFDALGVGSRDEAAEMVRTEPQAADIVRKIIGAIQQPEAAPDAASKDIEVPSAADALYGSARKGKANLKMM